MIGIIIVTHGNLAGSLIKTAEMIIGPQDKIIPVCFDASEGLDDLKDKVSKAIENVKSTEGVLVFTDMFGGSTSIVSTQYLKAESALEVITGVNLPMLLEAMLKREKEGNVKNLAKYVIEKSKKSIVSISEMRKTCQ